MEKWEIIDKVKLERHNLEVDFLKYNEIYLAKRNLLINILKALDEPKTNDECANLLSKSCIDKNFECPNFAIYNRE